MKRETDNDKLHRFVSRLPRYTIGVPIGIALIMVLLVIMAWILTPSSESEAYVPEARSELTNFAVRLESHISNRISIGKQIRDSLATGHIRNRDEFITQASYLHKLFSDIQAISWIDTMGIVRWVAPYGGNEALLNFNLHTLSQPSATLAKAERTGRLQITPPFSLVQGGKGFVAYFPVIKMERLTGFVNIVFRTVPLIPQATPKGLLEKYDIMIEDEDRKVYGTLDSLAAWDDDEVFHKWIVIGNRVWTVSLLPNAKTIAAHATMVDEIVLATLILLSIAIAYLIHLAMVRQLRVMATDKMLRTFTENSPSAIIIKDVQGKYLHTNSKWHEWFNPEGKEIVGQNILEFFPEAQANNITMHHKQIVNEKKMIEREYLGVTADGIERHSLVQMFPIMDQDGRVLAVGGSITDISANKKNEETLRNALMKAEEANLAKSKFLATMSHELRTPLNAIIGFSDILIGEYFGTIGNAKYSEYAKDINHSGRHLLTLINEVLDISAIELGKRDMQLQPLSVQGLLTDCVKSISHRADSRGIKVAVLADAALPRFYADEMAMRQIILNLLTNAIKFSSPGDQVSVSAKAIDKKIEIAVKDTGQGINEELLPTITQPFVKGHSSSHITHEGVGLGLSIVKSFVAAHSGKLHIESELGRGTTVTVTFPMEIQRQVD